MAHYARDMTNIAQNLAATAAKHGDRPGLTVDELTYTWREVDELSARVAGYLDAQGIQPGDRVALSLPNIPNYALIAYGVLRLGAVLVPMNPLFMGREVDYYLADSGAKIVFGLPGEVSKSAAQAGVTFVDASDTTTLRDVLASAPHPQIVPRDGADTAVILYTSGTTGRPKGAELTHDNLNTNQALSVETLLEVTETDVIMGCLPLFHVFGLTCGLNVAVATGALLTMVPRFDPVKVLEVIARDGVTVFEGVPTMYQALLKASETVTADLTSLRTCVSGGAALPVEVLRQFEERFGATILEGYGLSETSPVASFNHPHAVRKPGSIGVPVRGVEMMISDADGTPLPAGEVGEVAIRGENIMKGYWNKPDATAAAIREGGWFFTGDLARQDEDGYFYIVDRSKDMIIRGGYNIYPREVEEVLYEHPDVVEVAVVGIPHEHYGEEVAAYVVVRPESTLTRQDVQTFAKERVAAYKYPRVVHFIDALPKGATGKILKRELRAE